MRCKILIIGFLSLLGSGLSGVLAQTMYLVNNEGIKTSYLLSDIQKITFFSDSITINSNTGSSEIYALNGIQYLNFNDFFTSILPLSDKRKGNFYIYPNPVTDAFYFQIQSEIGQTLKIEIYSIDGKIVFKETINYSAHVNQIQVNTLPKGIYLCRIMNGRTYETAKFIKQ